MLMAIKSLTALIIISKIPKFNSQIGRTRYQIFAILVIIDTIYRIYVIGVWVLVWPLRVRSKSPVSIYQIFIVPSSLHVAIWVYWGWKAMFVIGDLWPFI